MASTTTSDAIMDAARLRMLTFQPGDGSDTLALRLSGGIALVAPPDDAPAPYGVLRITDMRERRSQRGRLTIELEAQWFHRPRAMARSLERIADIADQAMSGWTVTTPGGVIACVGHRRQTMQPLTGDDPELIRVRDLFDLVCWPRYLTQYLTTTP